MKRFLSLVCLAALAIILPAAAMISRGLPADTRPYVEKKYAGWSGVLRAWVYCDWPAGGSLTRWLNGCAADFERAHDGVYIEFAQVHAGAMAQMEASGIRPPELLLFSPGTRVDASKLLPLDFGALRPELRRDARAIPVAMGGYISARNPELRGGALCVPEDGARRYSAALIALANGTSDEARPTPEPPGLDLGLPAMAAGGDLVFAEDAYARFAAGEAAATIVTQREIAKLSALREAGRGPEWALEISGACAYTDQLLFASVRAPDAADADAAARAELAAEFVALLLEEASQARLADAGAFGVCGAAIHSDFSPYAPLDALLNMRELIAPAPFSEQYAADSAQIVRMLWSGALSPEAALARLRASMPGE